MPLSATYGLVIAGGPTNSFLDLVLIYAFCVALTALALRKGALRQQRPSLLLKAGVAISLPVFMAFAMITLLFARAWDAPDDD